MLLSQSKVKCFWSRLEGWLSSRVLTVSCSCPDSEAPKCICNSRITCTSLGLTFSYWPTSATDAVLGLADRVSCLSIHKNDGVSSSMQWVLNAAKCTLTILFMHLRFHSAHSSSALEVLRGWLLAARSPPAPHASQYR